MISCPYANSAAGEQSIRCAVLREKQQKWDFCIHQYYCREKGKYVLNNDAVQCNLKNQKGK